MTDDEQLAQQLRGQLDEELADLQVRAGSRERLRQGLRRRRRVPWLRASVLIPVGAALAIAALVLSIPVLLNRPEPVEVVPAGPPPVSATVQPTPTSSGTVRSTAVDSQAPGVTTTPTRPPRSVKSTTGAARPREPEGGSTPRPSTPTRATQDEPNATPRTQRRTTDEPAARTTVDDASPTVRDE